MFMWMCAVVALGWPAEVRAGSGALAMVSAPVQRPTPPQPALAQRGESHDFGLQPGQTLHAVLSTTLGAVDCTLAVESAPATVATFVSLARGQREWLDPHTHAETHRPLYDGTVFHRVIPDFLVQGGDPGGTGTGGPGFSIPDENLDASVFDRVGAMGLATRGPNTGGSQFFVTAGPAHHLDGRYTRFGTCENPTVIRAIASVPRGEHNRPDRDIVLRSVEIVAR